MAFDLDDAVRAVYATPPDEFLSRRAEAAEQAKDAGDAAAAREIAKLRKPTVAAWIVNALVHADDTVPSRVAGLGDELRAAQQALDPSLLRELSTTRRALVAELASAALSRAGRADASTTLQDEVRATLDAAVADPDVAARLGRLQRAESFSGFGFGDTTGPPQLTLVRGGKVDAPRKAATKKTGKKVAAAEDPARARALAAARAAVAEADAAVNAARAGEKESTDQVKQAERDLAAAKEALAATRTAREAARESHRAALGRRRDARRALDRAEKGR